MTLKENYERLFGPMIEENRLGQKVKKTVPVQLLTEAQQTKWKMLVNAFNAQYPKRALKIVNGEVRMDGFLVESAQTFLNRDRSGMIQTLKATHLRTKGK